MDFNYKAYEKSTGKMYICFGFNSLEEEIYVSNLSDDKFRDGVVETIRSVTKDLNDFHILQPTGVTDVNGNEIFEGDIVQISSMFQKNVKKRIGQVVFERGKYIFYENAIFKCDLDSMGMAIKVIGNIYEHKHLLEENENENK